MTTFDTLLEAMKRRVPVRATYNGKPRVLCPHVLGEASGEKRGIFLQVGGESTSATTIPAEGAWRCMRLDRMTDVTLDEKETWLTAKAWTGEYRELIDEVTASLAPDGKGVQGLNGRPYRFYAEPEAPEPVKEEPPCATYLDYIDLVLRLCTARTNQRERAYEDESDSRYGHFSRQRDLAKWARRDAEITVMAKAVEAERASRRWDDAPLARLAKEHGLEQVDEAALVYLALRGTKTEGGLFDFFVPKAKGGKMAPLNGAQLISAIASGRIGRFAARSRLYADAPLRLSGIMKASEGVEGAPETMKFTVAGALVRDLLGHGAKGDVTLVESDEDEGLVRRVSPRFTLADVVLGQHEREAIALAIAPARGGATLPSGWGLDAKIKYGKGIGLIFAGPPGTGKTLAGEAIAGELKRPLFIVQVPELMGMYVGETQKNIAEVFQRARDEEGGAVLLFDEADSLFFDRTGASRSWEVQDVNVLLTEVERHEGVVIMTTNRKDALDPALCRRVSAVVDFPMPDAAARAEIWRHLLPPAARLAADVDVVALAKAAVMSGGEIKNAVLHAVRLASHRKVERIDQALLVEAANAITSGRWGALHEKRRAGFLGDG